MSLTEPLGEEPADDARLVAILAKELDAIPPSAPFGLAVSGGGDSIALLHLAVTAAQEAGKRLAVVTVDHALRPGSAEEARFVAGICADLGVSHDILRWDHGGQPPGNLMQAARQARYGLMSDWARGAGISVVATGHTADDQAESFLMALSRAAGLEGLSGMRRRWSEGGVEFARPLLDVTRQELRRWLLARGHAWREDPTNDDPRFARVRMRSALAVLAPLGIDVGAVNASIRHLAAARDMLATATVEAFGRIGQEMAGAVILNRDGFADLHPETARRLLVAVLQWLSSADYPPRAASVARVAQAIAEGRDATLAGCRIRIAGADIRLCREVRAVAGAACATDALWDGRWRLSGPHDRGLEVRALGATGLRVCPDWRSAGLPREVLMVTPAVWRGATLVAAPLAGRAAGWGAEVAPDLIRFMIAH